jgi:hypothetical protein
MMRLRFAESGKKLASRLRDPMIPEATETHDFMQ